MNPRVELAAGLILTDHPWPDRGSVIAQATDELRRLLHPTSVWLSADLPPELRGDVAYGEHLVRWSPRDDVTPDEAQLLETAWSSALPPLLPPPEPWIHNYLRVRVDSPEDVRRLRAIGEVDGLRIVPSLDSRGRLRPFSWRWPFRVGVVAGPVTEEWLNTVKLTQYYPPLFDAEVFDAARSYDIGILSATELSSLPDDVAQRLGESACVIVVGDGPVEQHLTELDRRIEPAIAIAVDGPPSQWWIAFFEEMAHNVPVDAAVESIIDRGVDALIAGPRFGMDITAAARWFAAVGPDFPQLSPLVDELTDWDWGHESGGAMEVAVEAAERPHARWRPGGVRPGTTHGAPFG